MSTELGIAKSLGPLLLAIDHVGVAVADLDAAIEFYTSILGLRLISREHNPAQEIEEAMLSAQGAGTQIQLIAATTATSPIAKFVDQRGPGLQQLAFRVSDVVAAQQALTAAGCHLLYTEAQPGTNGSLINFIHPKSAGGVLIELVQSAS